ncbi:MAG: Cro/Cl family transcriptional regulator [Firmicutes bacterium]|nr:Cro/Cl family transcriptional regulator [Bacillota bacterium]
MAKIKQPEINERVKKFRLSSNLKQGEFALKIGIRQSSLSDIENIRVNVSDRVIKDICLSFNANEYWLRTGEGEMYIQTDDSLFAKLAKEYNLSAGMQELLRAVLDLNEAQREKLEEYILYFNSRLSHITETTATINPIRTYSKKKVLTDQEIEEELTAYRAELIAEQKGQSVLQNLGAKKA